MNRQKTKKIVVPIKFYTSYEIERIGENKRLHAGFMVNQNKVAYQITAKYFLFKGNVLTESEFIRTEKIEVSARDLDTKEDMLKQAIDRTRKEFLLELKMIGASPRNIENILKQKGLQK